MVDDKFPRSRNHDTVAREGSEQTSPEGIGDLLAELARLTGQGDPYGDGGRDGERLPRLTTAISSRGREASRPRAGE